MNERGIRMRIIKMLNTLKKKGQSPKQRPKPKGGSKRGGGTRRPKTERPESRKAPKPQTA